jgi:peptide/nickel transport system permease protein
MAAYLLRRLLLSLVVLLLVTLVTFVLAHSVPGDPLASVVNERVAKPEIIAAYRHKFGLDRPLPVQYLLYMRNLARGDLGISFTTQRPVAEDLRTFLPATLELGLAALLFSVLVGLPLGIVAALRHNRLADHVARAVSLFGASVPVFYLALLALFVLSFKFQLLPFGERLDTGVNPPQRVTGLYTVDALLRGRIDLFLMTLKHLLQPAMVLGAFAMGIVARMVRSSLLDVMGQDYIRTARAKGLAEGRVVGVHALRNALIPTVTIIGLTTGSLLAGAVLTETTFSWPGLGRYAVEAASRLDFPAVLAVTLISAVIYVTVNLIVDVLYGVLDPRIRQG